MCDSTLENHLFAQPHSLNYLIGRINHDRKRLDIGLYAIFV